MVDRIRIPFLSAYRPVLTDKRYSRLISASAVSFLGDGMALVGIPWLAIQLAKPDQGGVVAGLSLAAYTLPGALGALALGRWFGGLSAQKLVVASTGLRALGLATIAILAATDRLNAFSYIALLAASSLFSAWGNAGLYAIVSQLFADGRQLPANALLSVSQQISIIIGPAIAGMILLQLNGSAILAVNAGSYLILLTTVAHLKLPQQLAATRRTGVMAGFRILAQRPQLASLLLITAVFFFLYGPVEIGLPLYVAGNLAGSGQLLGAFWTAFGVGAVIGGFAGGALARAPRWPAVIAIIFGWGLTLLPFGMTDSTSATMTSFALGGLIYGPFPAFTISLFQQAADASELTSVLAARSAVTTTATPLGAALGGPLVTLWGAADTLLYSGIATITLAALVTASMLLLNRSTLRGEVKDLPREVKL
ncbi:MFS transporter [Salinispora fenicalii]|uniref:MFS transporter n=1 Tax=Salinispora fenicalii TaxID=1137263 RepID=UPI0004BA71AD|nr:MFS transporter [Salinispora fenicalii]